MAKKRSKPIDVKLVTRFVTFAVAMFALGLLAFTVWFIYTSLRDVSVAKKSAGARDVKVQGVDTTLLDKVVKAHDEKTLSSHALVPETMNPFLKQSVPAPSTPSAPTTEPSAPPAPQPTGTTPPPTGGAQLPPPAGGSPPPPPGTLPPPGAAGGAPTPPPR